MESRRALDPFGVTLQPPAENIRPRSQQAEMELLGELEAVMEDARRVRAQIDPQVAYNRAFLSGNQLGGIDLVTNDYLRIITQQNPKKFPSIDNKLLPTYRAYVGKMLRGLGLPTVMAFNDGNKEIRAAEGMTSYLQFVHEKQQMPVKMKRAFGITAIAPAAYLHPYWDPDGGPRVAYCPKCQMTSEEDNIGQQCSFCLQQAIIQLDQHIVQTKAEQQRLQILGHPPDSGVADLAFPKPDLNQVSRYVAAHEGELTIESLRWEDVYVDPAGRTPETVQYFFIVRPVPINVVRKMYPAVWDQIHSDDIVIDQYLYHDTRTNTLARSQRRARDHVLLRQYHEVPSGLYEHGRVITFTKDLLLDVKENTHYKLTGRLALYPIRPDVLDDSQWGLPWISQAISIQRERNKLQQQKRAHREITINPRWVYQQNSGITKKQLDTDNAGEGFGLARNTVIQPYVMKMAPLQPYVNEEADRMEAAIREKAGVTEHEMGIVSSDQSGRYAAFIESQSNESNQEVAIENTVQWISMWDAVLQLGYYYQDAHKVWTTMRGGKLIKMSWATIGLKPQLGSIYIAEAEMLSKNPVLRLSFAERLLQDGIFMDDTGRPDFKKFARYAGLQGISNYDKDEGALTYAAKIPELLKQGVQVMPLPWDRTKVIADELASWLVSECLDEDPQLVTGVAQIWLQYCQALVAQMQMTGMPPSPDILQSLPNMGAMNGIASLNAPQMNGRPGQRAQGGPARIGAPGGSTQPPGAEMDVAGSIHSADKTAESQSRQTPLQEGSSV